MSIPPFQVPPSRSGRIAAVVLTVVLGIGCGASTEPPVPAPPEIPAEPVPAAVVGNRSNLVHHVILWSHDAQAGSAGFKESVSLLGADGVSVPHYRDPEPFRLAGLTWYEDHASGKGTLGLREREWRPAWERFYSRRSEVWPQEDARTRPRCLRDPAVVAGLVERTTTAARRARGGGLAIVLEDEPSMSVRANPVDWCLCGRCVEAFRKETRTAWDGDLDGLNAAWETDYPAWDAVRPWTTAAARERAYGRPDDAWNLAPWIATRAFQDRTFADLVGKLRKVAAGSASGVPSGLAGLQAPGAFGGFDYLRLGAVCGFLEPYDIGLALPVSRDLSPAGTMLAQTVFPADGGTAVPVWRLWRGIVRGATTTIVWSSADALSDLGAGTWALSDYGSALAPELRLLGGADGLGTRLARADPLDEGVRIVVSQPSIQVRWMLDSREDGDTWPRRFGSYEATHSTAIRSRQLAWNALADRSPKFLDARRLVEDGALRGVRLVVLPDAVALSDGQIRALRRFRRGGGAVVADVEAGTYDEWGRSRGASGVGPSDRTLSEDFEDLRRTATRTLGDPLVRVTAERTEGGDAVAMEVSVRRSASRYMVVAVPAWTITTDDGGGASGSLPATGLRITVRLARDGKRVRNERTGTALGSLRTWTVETTAVGAVVVSFE